MQSTNTGKDGKMTSKIVATLKPGAGVVTGRNHVHYVVSEYGVADLYGKSVRQRVKALVNIAHPDFRAELELRAKELNWI
jgi:acetyl-CoA hydrolase